MDLKSLCTAYVPFTLQPREFCLKAEKFFWAEKKERPPARRPGMPSTTPKSEPEIQSAPEHMGGQVSVVGARVLGKGDRRSKGGHVCAGGLHLAKVRVEKFSLDRPVMADPDFHARAGDPAFALLFHSGVFMGRGEGISK